MKKPRDIAVVIDQVLAVVPLEFEHLIDELNSVKTSVAFAAPEQTTYWWRHLAVVLNNNIGQPKLNYEKQIARIFRGEE